MTNQAAQTMPVIDDFNGDNAKLIESARALISLSDSGSLAPHGIGGHARAILSAFIVRTEAAALAQTAGVADDSRRMDFLVSKCVEVREPARYGSLAMFRAQDVSDEGEGYRNDLRERIDQTMLSAAPAASGGECNCASGRGAEHCIVHAHAAWDSPQPTSSESVSERARALLAAECPECGGSNGYMVPAGEHGGAWQKCSTCQDGERLNSVSRYQALRALEQALTQQRGAEDGRSTSYSREALEIQGARWRALCRVIDHMAPGWDSGIVGAVDAAGAAVSVLTAQATTPQPSADAVRELVRKWREDAEIADRNTEGNSYASCADELESLLSGGSNA